MDYGKGKTTKKKLISLYVEDSQIKDIEKYAQKIGIGKSQLIRNFIDSGLSDVALMDKSGVLTIAVKSSDLIKSVKKAIFKDQYSIEDEKIIIDL